MVPDSYGHDINFNSFKTSVALKFIIILHNLIKTTHLKSGKSKYDRKLTEFDDAITRIRYRVNGVLCLTEKLFLVRTDKRKIFNNRTELFS